MDVRGEELNRAAGRRSARQCIGDMLRRVLPVSAHVFAHMRLELDGLLARAKNRLLPSDRRKMRELAGRRGLLANIGCGPFGVSGWVNLDLYSHPNITLRMDCRRVLPMADTSCAGIHVEHFLEHLDPIGELPSFLAECRRCLEPGGVLRVIVPDAGAYIKAYLSPGWGALNVMGCGGDVPEQEYPTKMDALNHVFLQGWEHYGGFDAERMENVLQAAGFSETRQCAWREGRFPGGCIDREQHRPYSLFFEAVP